VKSDNLKQAGLKVTYPRKRILEILQRKRNRHLTADDIYRSLVEANEEIGLATVYRVLNQFEGAGLVEKHNFESGQAFYELDSGEHHDHMVCIETGKVIEFMSDEIEAAQKKIAADHGYEIEDHSLVIYVRPKTKA
jgi:Fur family ferric uptake transcriptional regulator